MTDSTDECVTAHKRGIPEHHACEIVADACTACRAGEFAPMDLSQRTKGFQSIVRRFPIGPVSMVSPFNFPLNLAAHKIAPALAVG